MVTLCHTLCLAPFATLQLNQSITPVFCLFAVTLYFTCLVLLLSHAVPDQITPSQDPPGQPGSSDGPQHPVIPVEDPLVIRNPDELRINLPTSNVAVSASASSLLLGDALVLTCCVDQRAYPVMDWYFLNAEGDELSLPEGTTITDKGQLVVLSLTAEHSGIYQCVHRNVAGAESGEATVRVRGRAVTISPSAAQCNA